MTSVSSSGYNRRTPAYVAPKSSGRPVEFHGPAAVEHRLAELDHQIGDWIAELAARHKVFIGLKNEVEIETARAYMKYSGPAHAKKSAAILATEFLRNELVVAEAAFQFAKWKSDSLREQVAAVQSIGASLRTSMGLAGRGAA